MCRLLASELHSRHAFALDCLAASYRNKGLLVRVLLTTLNGPVLATWHPCSRQHSVPKIRESGGLLGLSAGTLSWDFQPLRLVQVLVAARRRSNYQLPVTEFQEYRSTVSTKDPGKTGSQKEWLCFRAVMNLDTQTRVLG
jgi:hypothetical protein